MIKLNLLPSYVLEAKRIRNVIVIFVVLLLLEGGIVFQAYLDLTAQEAWFPKDQKYFEERTAMIQKEKATTKALQDKVNVYDPYIKFFTRGEVITYNNTIATSIEEAAKAVGGSKAWFSTMTIKGKDVTVNGRIKGLMNFLNYYFAMKTKGFKITPAAKTAASPDRPTLNQEVPLAMTGSITTSLPDPPKAPGDAGAAYTSLFQAAGAAPAAGAGGAAPAAGGAGAPAGAPAGAAAGGPAGAPGR